MWHAGARGTRTSTSSVRTQQPRGRPGGAALHSHTYTSGRGTGRHVSETETDTHHPPRPRPAPTGLGSRLRDPPPAPPSLLAIDISADARQGGRSPTPGWSWRGSRMPTRHSQWALWLRGSRHTSPPGRRGRALLPGSFPAERILRNELFLGGCPHPPTPSARRPEGHPVNAHSVQRTGEGAQSRELLEARGSGHFGQLLTSPGGSPEPQEPRTGPATLPGRAWACRECRRAPGVCMAVCVAARPTR